MTVPEFNSEQLIAHLKLHGCEVQADHLQEETDRILMSYNGGTFPLRIKQRYFFHQVVAICESLGIESPEEHLNARDQFRAMMEIKERQRGAD